MVIKKMEIRHPGTGSYEDILYPRTSADMVDDLQNVITASTKITDTVTGAKYKFGVIDGALYIEEVN